MTHINHVLKRLHFCKKVNFLQPNELLHLCISLRTEYKIKSCKFTEEKLITTAMARFDRLKTDSPSKKVQSF